ncbi:MAG: M1 family metallopeptidase [Bacteroidia bacterium]|nr:M1 family metallopeptidase [Bacteroidia bacterium]
MLSQHKAFTKEDTLIGSNNAQRAWWDVTLYDITLKPDYNTKSIIGNTIITYKVISDSLPFIMQIDLQDPLQVDSIITNKEKFTNYKKENNRWMMYLNNQKKNSVHTIQLFYHGKPKVATNPPWDGGFVWKKDSIGNPWMSVACQGAGASVWFPCKDLQSEEPDNGALLSIIVPDTLVGIGNGKLISKQKNENGYTTYLWQVKNTINSYDIIPYIGKYSNIKDSVVGENGKLMTDYWILNYHENQAKRHLKINVIKTIQCLEYWFGPYPFYDDSYKIVESPYLGMEHQSNIAYGNFYLNGYLGSDLSNTGWGLKWDFIVVHETAHEWFGNSITASDVADNWIHEGFASYAEVLFTECEFGKEAGNDYCEGVKKSIENDIPLIGNYNVKSEGSGDIYNKGSQIIHMIRQLVDDDEKFRTLLRDISKKFYHKIISTKEFEDFISLKTGKDLKAFFNQYLRHTKVPKLEYKIVNSKLKFRYTNCINEFNMPLKIKTDRVIWIYPKTQWQSIIVDEKIKKISIDRNLFIK